MSSPLNYPLRVEPIFKERIWGGRRLETLLGKRLPPGRSVGESWEISDHGSDVSVVANGPHRGKRLGDLVREFPESLLGHGFPAGTTGGSAEVPRFPLLVKWVDACDKLSVQVHPRDGHPRLAAGEPGKTECWLVLDAAPGAEIYLGLRKGFDRAALMHELARGTADRCLNTLPARPGDFFFVPAGTVHSIGAGVLLTEVQQSSDTTFRLFDWNRIDPATGQSRELHIEAALEAIDFQAETCAPVNISSTSQGPAERTLLSPDQCSYFAVSWRRIVSRGNLGGPGHCRVLVCLSGSGEITGGEESVAIARGDSLLLPAAGQFVCRPHEALELLDAWLP